MTTANDLLLYAKEKMYQRGLCLSGASDIVDRASEMALVTEVDVYTAIELMIRLAVKE